MGHYEIVKDNSLDEQLNDENFNQSISSEDLESESSNETLSFQDVNINNRRKSTNKSHRFA